MTMRIGKKVTQEILRDDELKKATVNGRGGTEAWIQLSRCFEKTILVGSGMASYSGVARNYASDLRRFLDSTQRPSGPGK